MSQLNKLKEKIVLLKAKKGDREAFGQIYDWYVKKIYQFIYFKVNSTELAEDITQDVFLKLINYLNDKKEVRNLQALLYQIARNLVIDHYRKSQPEIKLEELAGHEELPDNLSKTTEELFEIEYSIEAIKQSMDQLKSEYKEIITLKYIEELTHQEIAEILGKKANHVRVMLHRAINELKNILSA